jgi:hypothetical protein
VPRIGQRGRDLGGDLRCKRGRRNGGVGTGVGGVWSNRFLHHLTRADQIHRASRLAAGELQRAVHELLDVSSGADLVVVLDVVAQDAALIPDILDPVDEFVAAAGQLAFLRERRHAREDQDGDASAHGVVDPAAEVLRTRVHMDDHGLRLTGDHGVGVRGGQGNGLVGADDDLRQRVRPSFRAGLCHRLDQPGMIAAEVGEDIRYASFR